MAPPSRTFRLLISLVVGAIVVGVVAVRSSAELKHVRTASPISSAQRTLCPAAELHSEKNYLPDVQAAFQRSMAMFDVLSNYGREYPEEWMGIASSYDTDYRIHMRFSGHVADHAAAVATLINHAPNVEVVEVNHTPAEVRRTVDDINASNAAGYLIELYPGMPFVDLRFPPGSEPKADKLIDTYGDLVRISVAEQNYLPKGCPNDQPLTPCQTVGPSVPLNPVITAKLEIGPTMNQSEEARGNLKITNAGSEVFTIMGSGSGAAGEIVDPATNEVVGNFRGAFTADLAQFRLESGQTLSYPIRVSAAACGSETNSLPPGKYIARAAVSFGPPVDFSMFGDDLSRALKEHPQYWVTAEAPIIIAASAG
jgi:hypothetical protein